MKRIRLASADDAAPDMTMGEAVAALARECVAALPVAVLVAWEEAGGVVVIKSLPDSATLRLGMVDAIYDEMHPPVTVVE